MKRLSNLSLPPATTRPARFPVIAIVTPVRNRREWSVGFARMIATQDYPVFKLFMVDSNSTDGTPDALSALNLPFLTVVPAPDSAYWSAATNLGVKMALAEGYEYVLTINDDAVIADDYLSRLMHSVMETNAKIVGSVIAYVDNPGKLWGVGAYNDWNNGTFLQLGMASSWDDTVSIPDDGTLLPIDFLCGNGTLIHASVFRRLGLYDEKRTPHYHSDSEFTMRAKRAGIKRWVSPQARLYNRFSSVSDSIFAARNQRLFSLRSANFARALIYILDCYCPRPLKTRAITRYFTKHFQQPKWRTWSRLLRLVAFLSEPGDKRRADFKTFFPPLDQNICAAQDLTRLFDLSDNDFAVMIYTHLLRRSGTDQEIKVISNAIRRGKSREELAGFFLKSPEFGDVQGSMREFMLGLLQLRTNDDAFACSRLSAKEAWIIDCIRHDGKVPSQRELHSWQSLQDQAQPNAIVKSGPLQVYMSIDVLCMAMIDPRAGTGVHRYVSNLLRQISGDEGVELRLFHSPRLAESCAKLIQCNGIPQGSRFAAPGEKVVNGLVFYPYFPADGLDPRFAEIRTILTVCDIFPLTNPEWFSQEAIIGFRRYLHDLSAADHLICISKATEDHVRGVLTGLAATTSVAHLGVDKASPSRQAGSGPPADEVQTEQSARYFLCVGTVEPRKNLRTVIAAIRQLVEDDVRDLEMWVVGQEGWLITADDLVELAGEAAPRIRFLGRVGDDVLWKLYAGAICTVFPSLGEGFGFPILESFAVGTPVITGNASSTAEIGARGAILVEPRSASEIATSIRRLATDHDFRTELSLQASQEADNYSWQKCASIHLQTFHAVAARR